MDEGAGGSSAAGEPATPQLAAAMEDVPVCTGEEASPAAGVLATSQPAAEVVGPLPAATTEALAVLPAEPLASS
eukprot:3485738-Lingulodinium_polyedra.AAC.1